MKKKKFTFNGEQVVDFDIRKEIYFMPTGHQHIHFKRYTIKADVIETTTGLSQSIEKTICINEQIYKVTADINKSLLYRGATITTKVCIEAEKWFEFKAEKKKKLID